MDYLATPLPVLSQMIIVERDHHENNAKYVLGTLGRRRPMAEGLYRSFR